MLEGAWLWGPYPFLQISSAQYTFIQLYMRLAEGDGMITFNLIAYYDDGDNQIGNVTITSDYIDNFYVDDQNYTRIRIPLADLGFSSNQQLSQFLIYRSDWGYLGQPITIYIDDIRIIGNISDPKAVGISSSDVYEHTSLCNDIYAVTSSTGVISGDGSSTGIGSGTSSGVAESSTSSGSVESGTSSGAVSSSSGSGVSSSSSGSGSGHSTSSHQLIISNSAERKHLTFIAILSIVLAFLS